MAHDTLTNDLLAWIAERPRTYDETMEAWRTSCPRLAIWDDAVAEGLVRVVTTATEGARVTLTEAGRACLAERRPTQMMRDGVSIDAGGG